MPSPYLPALAQAWPMSLFHFQDHRYFLGWACDKLYAEGSAGATGNGVYRGQDVGEPAGPEVHTQGNTRDRGCVPAIMLERLYPAMPEAHRSGLPSYLCQEIVLQLQ